MKFKLVEYPYGRAIGFNQDIVWLIQGTSDNKIWNNYVWNYDNCLPSILFENEICSRACPPISAYLTIKDANEAFDKITNYYIEKENQIRTLREVEI